MKVHDIVKLNPEIFPADKRNEPTFQAGKLLYPALILNWTFRINAFVDDKYHGEMVYVTPFDHMDNPLECVWLIKNDVFVKQNSNL